MNRALWYSATDGLVDLSVDELEAMIEGGDDNKHLACCEVDGAGVCGAAGLHPECFANQTSEVCPDCARAVKEESRPGPYIETASVTLVQGELCCKATGQWCVFTYSPA